VYGLLYQYIGWRGMFMIGIAPALLTFFILKNVKESPSWRPKKAADGEASGTLISYAKLALYAALLWVAAQYYGDQPAIAAICLAAVFASAIYFAARDPSLWVEFFAAIGMLVIDYFTLVDPQIPVSSAVIYNIAAVLAGVFLKEHWRIGIYAVLLMTAFNFFSHGTQDLYPTFLQVQQKFDSYTVATIAVIYNIGAILGSLTFGSLSERIGRRRAIVIAAIISLPVVPLWAFGTSPIFIAVAAFLMQFMVQSAWGIVPVHLNELSPPQVRGTFPGFTYQLGNLLASVNATIQSTYAAEHGNNYSWALAMVAVGAAIAIALLVGFGIERKGVEMHTEDDERPSSRAVGVLTPQQQE